MTAGVLDRAGERGVIDARPPARVIALAVALLPLLRPGLEDGNLSAVDGFILVAIVLSMLWLGLTEVRVRFPMFAGALLYMIAGALSAGVSPYPMVGLVSVLQDLVLITWALSIANACRTVGALRVVVSAWAWTSIAWAGVLVVAVFTGMSGLAGQEIEHGRAALTFVSPNQAGNYFAISLLVVLASPAPRNRILRIAGLVLISLALVFAASNASLGGVAAALVIVWILRVARRRGTVQALFSVSVAAVTAMVVVLVVVRSGVLDAAHESNNLFIRNTIGRSERSAGDRLLRFDQLERLYARGGVIGYGAAATKSVLESQRVWNAKSAHNDYIATMVERGVVGAFGLALIWGALVAMAAAIASRPLAPAFRSAVPGPEYLVGALVVIALAGVSHEVLHFRHVWALFGLVAAASLWGRDRSGALARGTV